MPSHLPPFLHCLGLPVILASVALDSMVRTLYDVRDFGSMVPPWLRQHVLGRRRLGTGALPALTRLYLNENRVGNEGMKAFAAALTSGCGALPTLKELYVDDGDHSQLVAALRGSEYLDLLK